MTSTKLSGPRALLAALACLLASAPAIAAPTTVTIAGSYQDKAGCAAPWNPACAATHLAYDATDDVWQGTFNVSAAGAYEYKAALNDSWTVSYGDKGGGANIPLALAAAGPVKFYYDDKSHWVTSNKNAAIATVAGSFQAQLGCSGDWQPDCLRSWLEDLNGDGIYTLNVHLQPGSYECKVAIDESWTVSYGAGGALNGSNIGFTVPALPATGKDVSFSYNATSHMLEIVVGGVKGDLTLARAHFLTADTIAWNPGEVQANTVFQLHADPAGALALSPGGVTGGTTLPLTYVPGGLSAELQAKYPHLSSYKVFKLAPGDVAKVPELLKGQLAIDATLNGDILDATATQLYGVLDTLYTYGGALGVTWSGGKPTLRVWAPTASSVALHLYDNADPATAGTTVAMTRDGATGTWVVTGEASWKSRFYLYEVQVYVRQANGVKKNLVTDPYSISLATNSKRSQIVDLNDAALKPTGWDTLAKPALDAPEDSVLYELHVRDFSITDYTVPKAHRGTFEAFTDSGSNGMKHLQRLAKAGLTHVHLLPTFDIATVEEDPSLRQDPKGDLAAFAPDSTKQREAISAVADKDGFNWGYDPFHFGVPEGSYSTDPNGTRRIVEFRDMVKALNGAGLRVVMDVVYNHTTASGLDDKSVLDKVVPGYYHRLNLDGNVETSTCCQNTATEHAMMEKLMVDTLRIWATAYKVDGFRFDLMGHHMKSNMLKVRDTLAALTPGSDGVDGSKIYLYGEGWNFGEVADGARGVNATQANMAGTGIGTFTDRLRDAVRGGSPFAPKPEQGFISGLAVAPNGSDQGTAQDQLGKLLHQMDLILVGLAGNLKDFVVTTAKGTQVQGFQVDYNGQKAGYASDPQEVINYVSAHDNDTLFDALQVKLPVDTSMQQRVRANNMGVSTVMLAQGIPFFHAGDEILRSKSGDGNSYNSGDWFNRIDWTYQTNNWGVGLPQGGDDALLKPLLANGALTPEKGDILRALDHFEELLKIRKSTRLLRLETAEEINKTVKYYATGAASVPAVVVMGLDNNGQFAKDYDHVVVVFNANTREQAITVDELKGLKLTLHPVQQASSDELLKLASFAPRTGTLSVPGRTTAVFVVGGPTTGCGCGQASGTSLGAFGLALMAGLMLLRRRAAR